MLEVAQSFGDEGKTLIYFLFFSQTYFSFSFNVPVEIELNEPRRDHGELCSVRVILTWSS